MLLLPYMWATMTFLQGDPVQPFVDGELYFIRCRRSFPVNEEMEEER